MKAEANSQWRPALALFAVLACVLWWLTSELLVLVIDEGIYLDGASRILRGQVPYRDFFVLTGPGTFWLEAALMKVAGISFSHVRFWLAFDLAAMTAIVYWLTAHLEGRRFACFLTFAFLAVETMNTTALTVNHRWDSGAFGLASVAFLFALMRHRQGGYAFAAGCAAAAAAWITPPVAVVTAVMGAWLAWYPDLRKHLAGYLGGIAACSIPAVTLLALQHALLPMLSHFLWSGANYAAPNRVLYGTVLGGYLSAFEGAHGFEYVGRAIGVAGLAVPAVLPIVSYVGWAVCFRRECSSEAANPGCLVAERRNIVFLLLCSAAFLVSVYPRLDAMHLAYVAPIFYVTSGCLLNRAIKSSEARMLAFVAVSILAAFFLAGSLVRWRANPTLQTAAGRVRSNPEDLALVAAISHHVRPGESLFVFPYMPNLYFLTAAVSSTRYSFLQPGMMTREDEAAALADLQERPPQWVVYMYVPSATWLRLWPNTDPSRLRMTSIEQFIDSRYRLVERCNGVRILTIKGAPGLQDHVQN